MSEVGNYSIREFEGYKVLDLKGNITSESAVTFEKIVKEVCSKESLIVNLENVDIVSSAGITTLVEVSQYARELERRVILVWANSEITKLVEITDNYGFLIFAESLEEAVTKIHYYT